MKIQAITAPNPGPFTLDGTKTYVIGRATVIDPGPVIDSHLDAIRAAAPELALILITHRHGDHAPGAATLKQRTGARVVAPRNVLDDTVVDERVHGGERFAVEDGTIEVIATPGHTAEHVCYFTSDGELFTGDTILGTGTTAVFPPDGHMGDYMRSLAALRALAPARIYPAHGPMRDDAIALIDEYLAHRLERERQVLAAIEAGAASITSLRARIYPDLDPALVRAAEAQLTAHVIKLVEEGRTGRAILPTV